MVGRYNNGMKANGSRSRNPVIVIPGVLGSKLVAASDSTSVWGEWRRNFSDPASGHGAQLFGLPMATGARLDQLRSDVTVDGALGTVRGSVAGVPVRITAYGDVMSAMGVESHADTFVAERPATTGDTSTAFEFGYDWRRSLDESAIAFDEFLQRARRFLQVQRGSAEPIRFDVVAHSMGGLVLRYYLQYGAQLLPHDGSLPRLNWSGTAGIDTAIIVGTPNAGSLKMVDRLVRGIPGNPLHPAYGPVLVGSFPSGYQMLPRSRHRPGDDGVDLLDPDFWAARDWGPGASWLEEDRARQMPGVVSASERRAVAVDHLGKCLANARVFQQAMDRPLDALPDKLKLHLFVGEAQRTPARYAGGRGDRQLRWTDYGPGDGTVLASSVRLDEPGGPAPIPWHSITVLKSNHMRLVQDRQMLGRAAELLGAAGHA